MGDHSTNSGLKKCGFIFLTQKQSTMIQFLNNGIFQLFFFTLFILYWGMVGGGLIAESCPTLATSWTVNPPSSSVHRISQARILE